MNLSHSVLTRLVEVEGGESMSQSANEGREKGYYQGVSRAGCACGPCVTAHGFNFYFVYMI